MPKLQSKTRAIDNLPTLVIVCGLPATGKSALAEKLAADLGWPLFAKDRFKELLSDAVHKGDAAAGISRHDSMVLGKQSIALLLDVAQELLRNRVPCIIEANFLPHLAPADLAPLLAISRGRQVHCSIPEDLVLERYRKRADAGCRHPVHVDDGAEGELIERIGEMIERIDHGGGDPLPLDVPLLIVDSTDGYDPSLEEIVMFCRS